MNLIINSFFINIEFFRQYLYIKLFMELAPNEVYYNMYIAKDKILPYGCFYIGDGNIFLIGNTYIFHNNQYYRNKILLNIKFINSLNNYNIDSILSDSYETIEEIFYNSIDDAINMNEMLKLWNKYKTHKCNKKFISPVSFKITNGNLLNKIKYTTLTLVDYIIFNKKLKMEDMQNLPFSYELREKINFAYNKDIFDMNEVNYYNSSFF